MPTHRPRIPAARKQNIFNAESGRQQRPRQVAIDDDDGDDKSNNDNRIAMATHANAMSHKANNQQAGSSSCSSGDPSSSSGPSGSSMAAAVVIEPTTKDGHNNEEARNKQIRELMGQFINPDNGAHVNTGQRAINDLQDFYLRQMRIRDRAVCNLTNIRNARDRSGRVLAGLLINIKPMVPAANDPEFSQAWAGALSKAEASLSDCIEQYLLNIIDTIDESICARVNQVLDLLTQSKDNEQALVDIKSTLQQANAEREKNNEEFKKRKRQDKDKKDGLPNKKFKKN